MVKPIVFTIITVSLNPEKHDLFKTVFSVVQQKYNDWELIIQDGGTINNSLSVIPEDRKIKIIKEKDSGIYDAMNKAISKASGKYICMLNAGDYFYDNTVLQSVAEYATKYEKIDFFYGNVHKPQSRSGYEIYSNKLDKYYLFSRMICHQAWFVSMSYYKKPHIYDTVYCVDGDRDFLLNMIINERVRYKKIDKVLVVYKGGGISQEYQYSDQRIAEYKEIKRKYYNKYEILFYDAIANMKKIIKIAIYDNYLSKISPFIQKKRARVE